MRQSRSKPTILTNLEGSAYPFGYLGQHSALTPIKSSMDEELEKSPVHQNVLQNLEKAFRKEAKKRIYRSMPSELKIRSPQTLHWRSGSVLAFSVPCQKIAEHPRLKEEKKSVVKALQELQRREQKHQYRSKKKLELLDQKAARFQESLEEALKIKGRMQQRKKERLAKLHTRFLDRVEDNARLMRNTASSFMKRKEDLNFSQTASRTFYHETERSEKEGEETRILREELPKIAERREKSEKPVERKKGKDRTRFPSIDERKKMHLTLRKKLWNQSLSDTKFKGYPWEKNRSHEESL